MSRPLSLAALTVLELTPPEQVRCAADAGYSHVGLRLIPATPQEARHDLVGNTPLRKELERQLADTGIRVLDAEIFRMRPDTHVPDLEATVATAAALGAAHLLVAGNDPEPERLVHTFGAFCELAGRYGLTADLEFMPWTDVPDLRRAAEVVAQVGGDRAGVLVDPFHLSRSRSRIADLALVPPAQRHYMQLCDVPATIPAHMDDILAEARAERLFPGEGELDLVALLRAMPAGIPLSIEVPTRTLARTMGATERARRALQATRRLLDRVNEAEATATTTGAA